ncbi:MAG: small ribosomal subunit Rsm22 family protein [Planctomycetes bacterium]|nr:small ribosomal subunit Rsm22 family protein [Planctomycetota bacterium]
MTDLPWPELERLRARFLAGEPTGRPYWESREQIAAYDATFGERIGWKWDAVLAELAEAGWTPPAGALLDFGCGSGVAGRRVLDAFGAAPFTALCLADRSPLATEFAAEAAAARWPGLAIRRGRPAGGPFTLVVSHVLGELDGRGLDTLLDTAARAAAVLWVEPGARDVSRRLASARADLVPPFSPVAPCPHDGPCPMLAPENERHWCHFLAKPPPEVLIDSGWVKFAKRAGIDLRRLPYSFLALDRQPAARPPGAARRIGEPRVGKAVARLFLCDREGLRETEVTKRADPELFRALRAGRR